MDTASRQITEARLAQSGHCLPLQRDSVNQTNLQVLGAILHLAEHDCKWRGRPRRFGYRHAISTCRRRWAKSEMLDTPSNHCNALKSCSWAAPT